MAVSAELTPGQVWYRNVYLQSEHWKATAAHFKALRGYKCEECGVRSNNLDVHHNGYADGYKDQSGLSLLWRERECPNLMQVLCRACHDDRHGVYRFPTDIDDLCYPWMTPGEAYAQDVADRLWEGEIEPEDVPPDHIAWEIVQWELMCDLGLDPDDPNYSELAAEGLEGEEEGNYDDEQDDRVGDADPADWDRASDNGEWDDGSDEDDSYYE